MPRVTETLTVPHDATHANRVRFETLYRESRDDVYAYVAGLLRDRSAAEEVTALAFERAFRKFKSFDATRGNERAWLFGIARNAAIDELRRRKRQAPLDMDPVDTVSDTPDERAELALRRDIVRQAMQKLQARDRDLVAMKFGGGLSNQEIAAVLSVSESNVGTMLHRAMQRLRKACDEL